MKEKIRAKGNADRHQSEKGVARSPKSKKTTLPTNEKPSSPPTLPDSSESEKGFLREDAQGFLDKLTELSDPDHFPQIYEAVLLSNIIANDHRVPINDVLFLAGFLLAPQRGVQQEESWRIVISWLEEQGQSSVAELLGFEEYGIAEDAVASRENGNMSSLPYPEIPVRKEVFDVLKKSQHLAEKVARTSSPSQVSVRHLLANILWGNSRRVKSHVKRLQYDFGELKHLFFLKVTEIWKPVDLKDAWAEFLEMGPIASPSEGATVQPEKRVQVELQDSGPTAVMEENPFENESLPEPLIIGDAADSLSDEDDSASVRQDVHAISAVLASRDLHLPLSLGVFGDMGMGKTYFMDCMYERIEHLTYASQSKSLHETAYCKNILQIRFKALNFTDGNPWVVMGSQILDEVYEYLSKYSPDSWGKVVATLEQEKGMFAEAKYAFERANKSVIAAERSLQTVQKAHKEREWEVRTQFNSLRSLLGVKAQIELLKAARRFGWGEELQTVDELSQLVNQLKSRTGRLKNFFKVLVHSEHALPSLGLLVLILLLPLAIGILVPFITQRTDFIIQVGVFIAQMGTLVIGGMAWIKRSLRWLSSGITELDDFLKKVEETREQRLNSERVTPDFELAVLREKESAARENLRQGERRLKEAEVEHNEAQPSRRLHRLLEECTESEDYRRRQGVVGLIRNDIECLSRQQSIPLERIILYIDDLDTCSAPRVVQFLEIIQLLLALPNFVVVVGADLPCLYQSLELQFPQLHSGGSDNRTQVLVSSRAHAAKLENYLENVIQIPFILNNMGKKEFQRLVRDLVEIPNAAGELSDSGIPKDLEDSHRKKVENEEHDRIDMGAGSQEASIFSGLTENDQTPVSLNPPTLELTSNEKEFLESMTQLLKTPRSLKKYVNIYRIFRARLTIFSLDQLVGTESRPGEYPCAMVLLGIITGYPRLAFKAMHILFQQEDHATWEDYVTNLKAQPPGEKDGLAGDRPASNPDLQIEWNRLCEALQAVYGTESLPFRISTFMKWGPQLGRYSFSTGPLDWEESLRARQG